MRSVKDYRNKLIIVWHEVKRKLYMGYVFIVRTFDFGQIHVKEELEFISVLLCLGFGQPDYFNWKHMFTFQITYFQTQSFHFKHWPQSANPSFIWKPQLSSSLLTIRNKTEKGSWTQNASPKSSDRQSFPWKSGIDRHPQMQ